jgi:hypothetical protein
MLGFKAWLEDRMGFSINTSAELNNSNSDFSAKGIKSKNFAPQSGMTPVKRLNPEKMFFGKQNKNRKKD